jgi:hypothetical protein
MAKRKTPKKEKIVDLKPKKITDEQLKKVQEVINSINRTQMDMGILETQKHNMLHQIAGLNDKLTLIRDEFEQDYGTTDINVQTGEIKYPDNGEADKKD